MVIEARFGPLYHDALFLIMGLSSQRDTEAPLTHRRGTAVETTEGDPASPFITQKP